MANGCGERGRYEREAAGTVESTVAENSGLEDAEALTTMGVADFDLEALMSRCWSPERRREELLIKGDDPNLSNFLRAYNHLVLNGEMRIEDPCFVGVSFYQDMISLSKISYRLSAGIHNERRYLTVEREESDVSTIMIDLDVDRDIDVQMTVGRGGGFYLNRYFFLAAHIEAINYLCEHYLDSVSQL